MAGTTLVQENDDHSEWLRNNPNHTSLLQLSGNNIADAEAKQLASMLCSDTQLTELNLSGNNISSAGATAWADALRRNITLTRLNLSQNNIPHSWKSEAFAVDQSIPPQGDIFQTGVRRRKYKLGPTKQKSVPGISSLARVYISSSSPQSERYTPPKGGYISYDQIFTTSIFRRHLPTEGPGSRVTAGAPSQHLGDGSFPRACR